MEPGAANGHPHVLGQGAHQPQVVLRELHPVRALHVERARDPPPFEKGDAHLGGYPPNGAQERGIRAHVLEEYGLAGARDAVHNPKGDGNAFYHPLVPYLVLEHQLPVLQQVGANLRVAVGSGDGLDDRAKDVGQAQLLSQDGAHPVQQGQLPRLAPEALLARFERLPRPLQLGDVAHHRAYRLVAAARDHARADLDDDRRPVLATVVALAGVKLPLREG